MASVSFTAWRISSSLPPSLAISWITWLPMLLVITMMVLVKSTVWPWLSLRRPSSSTCSSTLNTSRWAFSISSSKHHAVRAAADGFGEHAPFFVTDVARRGADQAADGVLFHELAHVEADHGVLVVEQHFGQGLAEFGFADAGGAEENERADRAIGILQAAAAAADGVGHGGDGFVLTDDALVQPFFEHQQFGPFGFEHAADRDAGPGADDFGDFVGADFLAEEAARLSGTADAIGGFLFLLGFFAPEASTFFSSVLRSLSRVEKLLIQILAHRHAGRLVFFDLRVELADFVLDRVEPFAGLLHVAQAELFGFPLFAEAGQLLAEFLNFLLNFGAAFDGVFFGFLGELAIGQFELRDAALD